MSELNYLESCPLSRATPFGIKNVSQTQFSIARHYGGMKVNGSYYVYFPETDELVRHDVLKWKRKEKKLKAKKTMTKELCSDGLCESCIHRAESIANVERWKAKGSNGLPCDPAPKFECKEHEGYGMSNSRKFCEDYQESQT